MPQPDIVLSTDRMAARLGACLRALAMTFAVLLPAVSVGKFILDPPSLDDIKWEPMSTTKLRPFLNGQVALIAAWAALASTRWYARWTVAAIVFLLTTRTLQVADPVLAKYFYLPWEGEVQIGIACHRTTAGRSL